MQYILSRVRKYKRRHCQKLRRTECVYIRSSLNFFQDTIDQTEVISAHNHSARRKLGNMSFQTCELTNTDFTKTIHQKPYATISVSRPELNQKGRTVLVTGGATNIGFAIAKAFIKAGAKTIVIIGRREAILEDAAKQLQEEGSASIITIPCDQSDVQATNKLWAELTTRGIFVDVLVLNAGDFIEEKPLLEISADRLWSAYETNVRGPLLMIEGLNGQRSGHPKV